MISQSSCTSCTWTQQSCFLKIVHLSPSQQDHILPKAFIIIITYTLHHFQADFWHQTANQEKKKLLTKWHCAHRRPCLTLIEQVSISIDLKVLWSAQEILTRIVAQAKEVSNFGFGCGTQYRWQLDDDISWQILTSWKRLAVTMVIPIVLWGRLYFRARMEG